MEPGAAIRFAGTALGRRALQRSDSGRSALVLDNSVLILVRPDLLLHFMKYLPTRHLVRAVTTQQFAIFVPNSWLCNVRLIDPW